MKSLKAFLRPHTTITGQKNNCQSKVCGHSSTSLFLVILLALATFICTRPAYCLADGEIAAVTNGKKTDQANRQKPQTGQIARTVKLANGLEVQTIKDSRFPLVCTRLYVRTGSANEDARVAGISHLLEHMVFKGTANRPKGQVAKDVEALGGYLNAATSFDKTWYLTDLPARHWKTGMEIVKEMAFTPSLDPAELEAEKDVVVSELQRGEDSPMRKLHEKLQVSTLHNSPYNRPIIGSEESVRSITVSDLKQYIDKWYQPQNMLLLVAGDIEHESVLEHARKLFGALENKGELTRARPVKLASAPGGLKIETIRGSWNKAYVGIAFPAPEFADFSSVSLDVLCYLLTGNGTSLLNKKYTYDKQLVDSISANNMSMARAGLFSITAQMDPAKLTEFWPLLVADLASLKADLFSKEAVAQAIFNHEDSIDRTSETLTGLTSWKGTVQFDLGGEEGERNLRQALTNTNLDQIQTAIDNWLVPERARICILLPEKTEIPDFEAIFAKNWPGNQATASKDDIVDTVAQPEEIDLGNGRKLMLLPDRTIPYVAMSMVFHGGNALLASEEEGLATLVARLLTDGHASLDAQGVEKFLADRAAEANASASLQTFGISISGSSRFNNDYFTMLSEMLTKPAFAQKELEREVTEMKSALKARADRPLSHMFAKIKPFIYENSTPYCLDSLGTDEKLASFTKEKVEAFWKKQVSQPWVLSVSGTFDRDAVVKFARSLPVPGAEAVQVMTPEWGRDKILSINLPGKNQAHLLQIFRAVPSSHEDAPGLMLLDSILSGQSGLLFTTLRDEQGLGYSVTSFYQAMQKDGYIAFYIGTTPDKIDRSRTGFNTIIDKLRTELLPRETLEAGVNQMLGEYLRGRQKLGARASEAAGNMIYDLPLDFRKQLIEKAAKITPEQLQAIVHKYLKPGSGYDATLMP